jgi:polysaccharide export outer membrane protein
MKNGIAHNKEVLEVKTLGQAMNLTLLVCFVLSVAVRGQTGGARQGQAPASSSPSGQSGASSAPSGRSGVDVIMYDDEDYKLGVSDVIEVIVEDAAELSTNYKINSAGKIPLRFLGSTPVAGKTTEEVAKLIADGLRGRYLRDPKVYVTVKQYNSRTFFIQGAVRAPGVYVVTGQPTLFKLITIAGGLQENHSSTAYIFREIKPKPEKLEAGPQGPTAGTAPGGGAAASRSDRLKEIVDDAKGNDKTMAIEGETDYELLTANIGGILRGRLNHNLIIQPSDVVYVPPADVFYVAGEVKSPGQYQLKQGITLRQAISLAQGMPFKAKPNKGVIFREDPVTGKFTEIPIDIGAVMKGDKDDVAILPNDVVYVPSSAFKSISSALLMTLGTSAVYRVPIGIP